MEKIRKIVKKIILIVLSSIINLIKKVLSWLRNLSIAIMLYAIDILIAVIITIMTIIFLPINRIMKDRALEDKEHIIYYLEHYNTNLNYIDLEDQNIKAKIMKMHKIACIENAGKERIEEDIRKLYRLKSAVDFREETVKDVENYEKDLVIMGGIVGGIVGSAELLIKFISKKITEPSSEAIVFGISLLLTIVIFIVFIGFFKDFLDIVYFSKEKKKSRNRQIGILMLGEMIEDREKRLDS